MLNWSYIAGFFDGEGCAGIYKRKATTVCGRVQCGIAQSKIDILLEIKEFLLREGINSCISSIAGGTSPKGITRKRHHYLAMGDKHAVSFLAKVYPFLNVKRILVQDLLRYKIMYGRYPAKNILATDYHRQRRAERGR